MPRVGIVGFGFMGRMHYDCWKRLGGVEISAICDANPNVVEDTQKAVGNIAGAAEAVDFDSLELYENMDKMLSAQDLDAISITLPTFLHPDFSIKALKAGVNVLCEKPMALTAAECDRMIEAQKKSGAELMIAHCIRFWPEYAKAKEIIDSGQYGPVLAATFQRLGAPPTWGYDNWFMDQARSGGMVLDLHIHDTDYVQYLFGVPKAVCSHAAKIAGDAIGHILTEYDYSDPRLVTAEGSWLLTGGFGFEMSFNIVLEKATIVYGCTREPAFKVCPADGEVITPDVEQGDGYSLEIAHFAKLISGRDVAEVTTLQQSKASIEIIAAERESAQKGRRVSLT